MSFKIKGSLQIAKDLLTGGNLQTGDAGLVKLADGNSSNFINLKAPTVVATDVTLTFPDTVGTSNQVLTTDGSTGQLSWSSPGGGGTVTSVGLTMPTVFSVANTPVTGSGTLAVTFAGSQTQNQVLASPNGTSGAVALRALVAADIPTIAQSQVTSLTTDLSTLTTGKLNLSGGTMTGTLTLFDDPVSALHAATKQYVDAVAVGLDFKASVKVATTANITLSGTQTIDGVALNAGDRVLVKNQSTAANNGIYVVAGGAWARSTDADTSGEVNAGMYCFVEEGTTNADSGWVLSTNNPITLNSTALTFTQFTGTGQITAGTGLTKTGNTLAIDTAAVPTNSSNLSFFAATTSAQLAGVINDETGSAGGGVLVFSVSPALTGTPTAPTAAANTNTTQLATTAFVVGQAGAALPIINGTATVGTSLLYSRQDHIHPTDTTRAPLASPTFTGTPAAPTASAGTNTTQLATTAFVQTTVAKYAQTFNATTDWGSPAGGFYTITVAVGTHGKGTSPAVRVEEGSGADWIRTLVDQEIVRSTGNVEIKVSDSPDARFAGRILIY